ncbi:MAG: tetratricopeptide repeat protein [Phycisphaerales bacterium JB050]
MASKVNTKFVVILVGALLALAIGVGGLAAYSLRMSGERNIAAGDRLMVQAEEARAQGDQEAELQLVGEAAGQYGRAVSKDRTRREWLLKLRDALLLTVPDTGVEYEKKYTQTYLGVLDQLASLDPTNGYFQHAFVEAREELARVSSGPNSLLQLESDIDRRVRSLDANSPMAIRLNALRGLARTDRAGLEKVDQDERDEARQWMQRYYDEFLADTEAFTATPVESVSADAFVKGAHEDHKRIALGLIRAEINEHQIAQNEGRAQDARQFLMKAEDIVAEILAENPDYAKDARFQDFAIRIPLVMSTIEFSNPVRQREARELVLANSKEKVFEALAATDAEDLPLPEVFRFTGWYTDGVSRDRFAREVKRVLDDDSSSPHRLFMAGRILSQIGHQQDALEVFDRILTMPKPRLSLAGVLLPDRRLASMTEQARIYLDLRRAAIAAGDQAKAEEYLNAAIAARDRLAEESGTASRAQLLLTDANIAIAQNQTKQAIRLLEEFRKDYNETPEILADLANQLLRDGNRGEARQILEQLVARGRVNPAGAMVLAELYREDGELDRALEMLQNEASRSSTPEAFADAIALSQQLIDIRAGKDISDPLLAAVVRTNDALARRDIDGATRILDRLVARQPEAASDVRVVMLRAQIDAVSGRKDAAIARLERALAANPENSELKNLLGTLSTDNPVEHRLAMIEASDASEAVKALRKYELLRSAGRHDEALAELDTLERLDPTHPVVLDARFADAVGREDFARAERIVGRAEEANADGVDGLLYRGRLQAARGELASAVRTLRTAVELVPSSIEIRRYLGRVLLQSGQVDEGLDYLRSAYVDRKDNLVILSEYVQILRQLGRVNEARALLDPGDDPTAPARQSRMFTNIWLTLEAQSGNTTRAIEERRTYFRADLMSGALDTSEEARANAVGLIELLISGEHVDEAQRVLDQARTVLSTSQIAIAEAGLAVARAKSITDPQESQQAIEATISALQQSALSESARTDSPGPLMEAARFAFRVGGFEQAMGILRSAAEYESGTSRDVSREIAGRLAQRAAQLDNEANALLAQAQQRELSDPLAAEGLRERAAQTMGRAEASREEAADVYANLLSSGADDDDFSIALSLAELLIQTEQLDRASTIVSQVREAKSNNLNATLLAAQIASRKGDRTEAIRLFNQAVERNSTNYLAFYQRALYLSEDSSRRTDVLADLRRVNELRPSFTDGWLLRFHVTMQSGDSNAAFAVLRNGISTVPAISGTLTQRLVQELLRAGRDAEAQTVASERADENPDSLYWQYTTGLLAKQRGAMGDAARYFTRVFEHPEVVADPDQQGQAAMLLLDAKLRAGQSVSASQLGTLLPMIERLGFEGATGVSRAMLLARAFAAIPAERSRAGGYIQKAYLEAVREDGEATATQKLRAWFQDLPLIVGGTRQAYDYVAGLEQSIRNQMQQNPGSDITNPLYLRVLALQAGQVRGDSPSDLIARGQELLVEAENDPIAQFEIKKGLSTFYYTVDDIESATQYGKDALAINANDLELLNNVAYFLAKYLNRPTEALPFADRAVQLAPENPDVLDTVGVVYMLNGEADRAVPLFENALQFASSQEQRLTTSIHYAEALLQQGNEAMARQYIEDAERLLPVVTESAGATYGPELERVKGLLETR